MFFRENMFLLLIAFNITITSLNLLAQSSKMTLFDSLILIFTLSIAFQAEAFSLNRPLVSRPTLTANIKMADDKKFLRTNPLSDKFKALYFHHLEFYCQDASSASK
jgi:hypothetical protein